MTTPNIPNNFFQLIGCLEAAIFTITTDPDHPDILASQASGDPQLDPNPGTLGQAVQKLQEIKAALLQARVNLLAGLESSMGDPVAIADAWEGFRVAAIEQSFVFATAVRRIMPQTGTLTGAPQWNDLPLLIQTILKVFGDVALGGGTGDGGWSYPGILGSSAEMISIFPSTIFLQFIDP